MQQAPYFNFIVYIHSHLLVYSCFMQIYPLKSMISQSSVKALLLFS